MSHALCCCQSCCHQCLLAALGIQALNSSYHPCKVCTHALQTVCAIQAVLLIAPMQGCCVVWSLTLRDSPSGPPFGDRAGQVRAPQTVWFAAIKPPSHQIKTCLPGTQSGERADESEQGGQGCLPQNAHQKARASTLGPQLVEQAEYARASLTTRSRRDVRQVSVVKAQPAAVALAHVRGVMPPRPASCRGAAPSQSARILRRHDGAAPGTDLRSRWAAACKHASRTSHANTPDNDGAQPLQPISGCL